MADAEKWIGGRYRLVRQLAAGGMGTVWEGWDERLHRTVAIKQLQMQTGLSGADAEVAAKRVMREARLTARLHHPNAVQVFDVVDDNGRPCLVMQYVPSRSLQEVVRSDGPLDPPAAARIGTQVAAALAAAHRAGIVHRDVKPGNVLIAEDGTAKITDFGISHAVDDVSLTSTGLVTGTPAYLAPEVARGADSGFASDVYSLGATLYMAVEGQPPTGDDSGNPMAVLHRAASGDTIPPVRSGPLTPALTAMMAVDPATRPNMIEVANRLTDVGVIRTGDTTQHLADGGAASAVTSAIHRDGDPPGLPPLVPGLPDGLSPRTMALESSPPMRPPAPGPPPERSRALWPVFAVLALVIILGIVLGIALLGGNSGSSGNVAGGQSSPATSPSAPRSSHSASKSATTHATKPSTRPPTTQSVRSGPPTAAQLVGAVRDYYTVVPGDLNAGWQRLTPYFQATKAHGRANYDSFWNTVSRVDVNSAQAAGPYSAVASLTYHYKNGKVVSEQTRFDFVRQDGILKINHTS